MRLTLASVSVLAAVVCASAQLASQLNTLTGNQRTRVVWLEGGYRLDGGGRLMGFDTQDNTAPVQILAAATKQNRPIICSGGYRIVVTRDYQVYVVNWDGTGLRLITSGIATDTWVDPNSGLEWVVVRKGRDSNTGEVHRYMIDDPSRSVLLWNQSAAGDFYMNWYQVSADGKIAVDFLPWDRAFVVDSGAWVANGFYTNLSRGCWSSLASDNSYHWVNLPLTGLGHAAFNVFRNKDTVITQLPISAPRPSGASTDESYHPRFASNGGRYICLTKGYSGAAESDQAEVFLGKFSAAYTAFDGWVRVTTNSVGDYTPDAWVGVSAPAPSMRFTADSLSFTAPQGGANPSAKLDTVSTASGSLTGVTVSDNASWLTVSVAQSGAQWIVTNSVSVSGLSSGVHRATVSVNSSTASPSLRTYTVKLTVTGTAVATSLVVTPSSVTVAKSSTFQLTSNVYDQMEQRMSPQPSVSWSVLAPANGVSVSGTGLVSAGTTLGRVLVSAVSGTVRDTVAVSVVDFIPVHIKVNCGDPSMGYVPGWAGDAQYIVPGHEGSNWLDDQGWTVNMSAVTNPPPRDVFVRFRGGAVWYTIPSAEVPAGAYRVRLHFWEPYANENNTPRSISCSIEGATVMTGFRPRTEAGALSKAVVKEFDVTVNGDGLQIQIGGTQPMIVGMEVISSGSLAKQITILEPVGGQTYAVGQVLAVRWTALPTAGAVAIEMSPNGGDNWFTIVDSSITQSDAGWGAFRWTIPPTVTKGATTMSTVSSDVIVRVYKYVDPGVGDVSPSSSTILASTAAVEGGASSLHRGPSVRRIDQGVLVTVPGSGRHQVDVFDIDGRLVQRQVASEPRVYVVASGSGRGCLVVRVRTEKTEMVRRVYLK